MKRLKHGFLAAVFTLLFVFSGLKAQDPVDTLFLEIVDSNGAPVKEATIDKWSFVENRFDWVTLGESGDGVVGLSWYFRRNSFDITVPLFRITKRDYYPFYDLGTTNGVHGRNSAVRIEILKIPRSEAERKAIGKEQSKREFITGVAGGDVEAVGKLLKNGISPNLTTGELRGISNQRDIPAIMFPVFTGDNAMMATLLGAGAAVSPKNYLTEKILIFYLDSDHCSNNRDPDGERQVRLWAECAAGAKMLINAGAKFKWPGQDVITPLMFAARYGNVDLLKFLIAKGAPVNALDDKGYSALCYTGMEIEPFKLLLEAGADPNVDGYGRVNLLIDAVSVRYLQQVKLLIDHKADINVLTGTFGPNGQENLLATAKRRVEESSGSERRISEEIVKMLIAAGAR